MSKGLTVNEHHLIPRFYGGKETHFIHRVCHSKIHSILSEAELAFQFNTFEKLLAEPRIQGFVKWIRKRPVDFTTKHRSPRRMK